MNNNLIWEIFGGGLEHLYIRADCFDEALAIARKQNPRYDSGRVASKRDIKAIRKTVAQCGK